MKSPQLDMFKEAARPKLHAYWFTFTRNKEPRMNRLILPENTNLQRYGREYAIALENGESKMAFRMGMAKFAFWNFIKVEDGGDP